MLSSFRSNASNPLVWLPVGVIVFVFVFTFGSWGGGDLSGNMPMAAVVNGRVIPESQFAAAYSLAFQNNQRFRRGYDVEAAKAEGLKDKVLEELVERELLAQLAEGRGLTVSDDELVTYIQKSFFGPDRPFDREEYKRLVNGYFQTSEPRFEEQVRRDILADRMQNLITESVHVSPSELKDAFDGRFNRANLDLVRIDPLYFKDIPAATEAQSLAWAEGHAKEVEDHYNKHINRYRQEKKVKARHILIKVDASAADDVKAKAKERIQAALTRVQSGEDFAKVATELSEDDGSKANGGDLGTFGKGRMVKPFEDAAFALEAGQLSEIVESRFGYHVIKVEEVIPPQVKELTDVRGEIATQLMREAQQKEKARALADQALADLKAGKAPEALALPELQLPSTDPLDTQKKDPFAPRVENTGFFSKNSRYVPRVGVSEELVKTAFELTKEAPVADRVFEVSGRFYLVKLNDRESPDPEKFDQEKESLENSLLRSRQGELLDSFTKDLREKARVEKNAKVASYGA